MFKHSSDLGAYSMKRVTNWPTMTAAEKRKGCPTGAISSDGDYTTQ